MLRKKTGAKKDGIKVQRRREEKKEEYACEFIANTVYNTLTVYQIG